MKRTKKPIAWLKIYDARGQYRASFVDYSDAAAFVAILGKDANVRNGHGQTRVIWLEGHEEFSASESYDRATEVMHERVHGKPGADGTCDICRRIADHQRSQEI